MTGNILYFSESKYHRKSSPEKSEEIRPSKGVKKQLKVPEL